MWLSDREPTCFICMRPWFFPSIAKKKKKELSKEWSGGSDVPVRKSLVLTIYFEDSHIQTGICNFSSFILRDSSLSLFPPPLSYFLKIIYFMQKNNKSLISTFEKEWRRKYPRILWKVLTSAARITTLCWGLAIHLFHHILTPPRTWKTHVVISLRQLVLRWKGLNSSLWYENYHNGRGTWAPGHCWSSGSLEQSEYKKKIARKIWFRAK